MRAQDYLYSKLGERSDLAKLILNLLDSIIDISKSIDIGKERTNHLNSSGDQQLEMDVLADITVHDTLVDSDLVALLASEERSTEVICNGDKFCVVYDPLDGSSLVDANLAIGSIFGIYPGTYVIGRTPREMVGSMFAVYGPRTTVMLSVGEGVCELILDKNEFVVKRDDVRVNEVGSYFAPGNLRAYSSSPRYQKLISHCLENQFTLRYSGGMVPDINHILVKGEGIFTYPGYKDAPEGKLRLLYECGPMSYLIENAGGKSSNGYRSILDLPIKELHQRSPIFVGSRKMIDFINDLHT